MASSVKVIKNGQIITPTQVLDSQHFLVIEGNKITHIGNQQTEHLPKDAEVLDAQGKLVSPGLIDIHVHGCMGYKASDANHEALNTISKTFAAHGVTGFLATTHADPAIFKKIAEVVDQGVEGARILGIHSEGPFLNPKKKGAQYPEHLSECKPDYLRELISAGSGLLKQMTIAPELPGAHELIEILDKRNIVPAMGHTYASYDECIEGIKHGVRHVTHTFNAMRDLEHREPGGAGAALACDELSAEIICDGVHVHPSVIKVLIRTKPRNKVVLITDAIQIAGQPDGEYIQDEKLGVKVYMINGEARLNPTTLAGSSLFMNRGLKNVIHFGDLDLVEGVRMGSFNPALVIGMESRKGTLEVGKEADIVFFDEEFNVYMTMVEGKVVYTA
jgi:N-acetylglucosamine-6-phosphate deacetylase